MILGIRERKGSARDIQVGVLGPASTVENEQPLGVLLPITARFEALRGPDSESIQPRLLNNIFSGVCNKANAGGH